MEKMQEQVHPPQNKIENLLLLFKKNELLEALAEAKSLLAKYKNSSYLFNITGTLYAKLERLDEAISLFLHALKLDPDNAQIHYNLAKAFSERKKFILALPHYEKAVQLKPDFFKAWYSLGLTHIELNHFEEARSSCKKALAIMPEDIPTHDLLGFINLNLSNYEKAFEYYNKALTLNPDITESHHSLGNYYQFTGQKEKALKHYQRALEINPNFTSCYHSMSPLKKYTHNDSDFEKLKKLLSNDALANSDKANIHFVLSKAYEDIGDNDQFLYHLELANKTLKKTLSYQNNDDTKLFRNIMKVFKSCQTPNNESTFTTNSNIQPIFIVGMPRSGTSLIEQILSSHSTVYGAGELSFLEHYTMPNIIEMTKNQKQDTLFQTSQFIMENYFNSLKALHTDKYIITDKMPSNFRWLGFILLAYPQAKIIHLNRNPMAICWSIYKRHFPSAKGLEFMYDLKDLGKYYNLYTTLMDFWRKMFPGKIYDINYESLTENQEEETRKLLEYCGLEWEESCLEFHKTKRAVVTASSDQVRNKMYQGSSESWRRYDNFLKPLKMTLNYFD